MEDSNSYDHHHVVVVMDEQNPNTNPSLPLPLPLSHAVVESPPQHNPSNLSPKFIKTLNRLHSSNTSFSKPKSRSLEFHLPPTLLSQSQTTTTTTTTDIHNNENSDQEEEEDDDEDDDDDDDISEQNAKFRRRKKMKMNLMNHWSLILEWILFLIIMTCLICSLTISSVKVKTKWGLEIWKWCLFVLVIISGRLVSGWVICCLVFFIERNFMLREKVLYFVYGLRKSFQNCFWLGLVLLAWGFMFNTRVIYKKNKVLKKVFQALVGVLAGATIWLVKIVLVKVLASSFHVTTYFDRMKESVFHHYVLDTLSGPPMDERERMKHHHHHQLTASKSLPAKLKELKKSALSKSGKVTNNSMRRIDIEKLKKLSMQNTASAWNVKRLVNYVRSFGLSTISRTVDEFGSREITSEWEARNSAKRIFKNVAKPGAKYIEEEDLMRFLKRVEIHTIFPLCEGALETGRITKSAFRNWVVRAYYERKYLAHSLNDTKTAVQQLHKLASGVVSVIIIVVFLLVMGLASTKVIAVIITQLLLLGFTFQNMCKNVFESIVFVFVMHPFDIGDRCVVDGVQMIVEEMNILSTVFLRYDNEKIYYPNSVLITKPISNFYRSPEMCDAVDFTIDLSTSMDTIFALKKAIQAYIESKPKYWNPKHSVIVKEIENVDKLKMALCVQHTINHQNYGDRNTRITDLIFELKRIFENLNVKYHLLPQQVHLTQLNIPIS